MKSPWGKDSTLVTSLLLWGVEPLLGWYLRVLFNTGKSYPQNCLPRT